jgi:hypothetical protein
MLTFWEERRGEERRGEGSWISISQTEHERYFFWSVEILPFREVISHE